MTVLKHTIALLLPLIASAPLLASMNDDDAEASHRVHYFRFETAYSAVQYESFFKTAHFAFPSYPLSCISGPSRKKFIRDAFYYGITSLESTDAMRATSNGARFDFYKTAVALVNMTAASDFDVAFDDSAKRGKSLYKLLGLIEQILPDLSRNRHVSSANELRYPLQLSRLILRVGHFRDLLDTHQNRLGFDVARQDRWMDYLWNDLRTLKGASRTVVIETLMAKMILEHSYKPAGIDDPLNFAANLLLENHTHPSGENSSSSYSRSAPEIHHLTTRTTTVVAERLALRNLLRHKQEMAWEASDTSSFLSSSPSSSDSSLSSSMELLAPLNAEPFASAGALPLAPSELDSASSLIPSLADPSVFVSTAPFAPGSPSLLSSSSSNNSSPSVEDAQRKKRSAFDLKKGKGPESRSKEEFFSHRHKRASKENELLTNTLLEKVRTAALSASSAASVPFFSSGSSSSSFAMGEGDNDFLIQVTLEEVRRHVRIENFNPIQAIQNYRTVFSSDSRSDEDLVHKMVPYILANYGY